MPETMNGGSTWYTHDVISDLINQAKLEKELIKLEDGDSFRYKGRKVVIIDHKPTSHLIIGMEGKIDSDLEAVINSFSKVVGYDSFTKYKLILNKTHNKLNYLIITEWEKINPSRRRAELSSRHHLLD